MPFVAILLALVSTVAMVASTAEAHRLLTPARDGTGASSAVAEPIRKDADSLAARTRAVVDSRLTTAERLRAALARHRQLAELIESDPAAVLRAALAPAVRAALPPELQALVEEEQQHEGELQIFHADGSDASGVFYYGLRTASGEELSLRFAGIGPALPTGTAVRVHGVRVGDTLALGGSESVTTLALAILPSTFGEHQTLVALVRFTDTVGSSPTITEVQSTMFGTGSSVGNFLREASYGQTWLAGTVVGPLTISMSRTVCDYKRIASLSNTALANLGIVLSGYQHIVYAFPGNACTWRGLGSVGGSPGQVWINGSVAASVTSHELGHNLGLYHSHALECGAVAIGGSCSRVEYGDLFDVMGGGGGPTHFNAVQKSLLGWLGYGVSPPLTDVSSTGTYTIDPLEASGVASKALRIQRAPGDWLLVEYRQPIGFDSYLSGNASVMNGVLVHYWSGTADGVFLLDMTAPTASWADAALPVGSVFDDTAGKVTITPVWADGATAGVNVTIASASCVRRAPTVTLSPTAQEAVAGTTLAYGVSVKNNGSGCGVSTFSLAAVAPAGWIASLADSTLIVAEGATGSTTLHVTSSAAAAPATYGLTVSTSDEGLIGSASASYAVTTTGGSPADGTVGTAGSFTDLFDRPDAVGLDNGWSMAAGQIDIVAGEARNETLKLLHVAVQPSLAGAAQTVSASFASVSNNSSPRFGLVLRYQDEGNYYLCYRQIGGSSVLRIAKVVNGVETILKAVSIANPMQNALFTLSCQANGTSLTLLLGGAIKATATDPTFASGTVGFAMGGAAGGAVSHRADGFVATVQ